ncbi:helix-turn-helix transcriptional regulator, partial [Roseomonas aerophila]
MAYIGPIAETADTVTLRREDFDALIAAAEDTSDRRALAAFDTMVKRQGLEAVRADSLTMEEVMQIAEGVSPIRVWRKRRGLTARALSEIAGISPVYLSEIETGKKPGSAVAIVALAKALGVDASDLLP